MRVKLFSLCLFSPFLVFGVVVPSLPPGEFADTEVSTNLSFAVDLATMSRVEFALSLDASPSNAVEISIGNDANGDGSLSTAEAAWTFGYSCGRWFTRCADGNGQTDESALLKGRLTRTFLLRKGRLDLSWNLVRVVRRGVRSIGEVAFVTGSKPGFALEVR